MAENTDSANKNKLDMNSSDDNSTEEEDDSARDGLEAVSMGHATVNRLLLPTAIIILSALYIESTWGRISVGNLRYPYFIIFFMLVFTGWVYIDEIRGLLRIDQNMTTVESVKLWMAEWRLSLMFGLLTIVYIFLIDTTGFYSASFAAMTSIMYIAGVRNYKLMTILPSAIILVIYIVFEIVVRLRPPRGLIDSLVLF